MSRPAPDGNALAASVELLDHIFGLVRALALHGPDAEPVQSLSAAVESTLARARPPFALLFLPEAVLRDALPLPLSLEQHRRAQQLVGALARFGTTEVAFDRVPQRSALIAFASAMRDATHKSRAVQAPQLPGIALRARLRPGGSLPSSEAANDLFAIRMLERACAIAEPLAQPRDAAWHWEAGHALVWLLERALQAGSEAAARELELSTAPWSPAKRAVAAALYTGALLSRLRVSTRTRRAAVQATLALGCSGFEARAGLPSEQAARQALARLLPASDAEVSHDPQRLRVCTLVAAAAQGAQPSLPIAALLATTYTVELARCPRDLAIDLSRGDLQAFIAASLGRELHSGWGRALLQLHSPIAAGTHVLCDGRLGLCLGYAGVGTQSRDPRRPRVLVGGQPCLPEQPLQVFSPLGMTPWLK